MADGVWVVLPTYNEAGNLPAMLAAIRGAVPDARVLVVDDRSPDGTGEIADAAAARDANVKVLHREENKAWAQRTAPASRVCWRSRTLTS